tara:strand:+ start:1089 stop:1205 length:117 start_codon:yes stop_codon:yes gene_type:complete
MADLAVVLHMPPAETGRMNLEELMYWHAKAMERIPEDG